MRIEPPMSVPRNLIFFFYKKRRGSHQLQLPSPNAVAADATKAASPPEDPPTVRRTSYGLFVCPVNRFLVSCLYFNANFHVLVSMSLNPTNVTIY